MKAASFGQQIVLLLALALIYNTDGELIIYSPSIIVSILAFILSFRTLLKERLLLTLLFLAATIVVANPDLSVKEIGRLIFSFGAVFLINYIKIKGREVYIPVVAFFFIELLLRILGGDFSDINLYSIKGGAGLYGDSNFVGLILVYCIAGLIDRQDNDKDRSFILITVLGFLLLATFSRTAWIMLFVYLVSRKSLFVGFVLVFLAACAPFYFLINEVDVGTIDGSLASKITIFNTFAYLLDSDPWALVWGLGRVAPGELAEQLTGTKYQGHTIYGQIVQYGLLINIIFYWVAFKLANKVSNKVLPYAASILVGGFLGLSPTSYFGITLLMYGLFSRDAIGKPKSSGEILFTKHILQEKN